MAICLVGEADWFLARLLRRFGEASGFEVVQAQAGQDLLALARRLRPAVIIVETELPGTLRGWEAIQVLRSDVDLCETPVVTCSWQDQAAATALLGPVAGHLQKPDLHYADFLATLAQAKVIPPDFRSNDTTQPG